MSDQDHGASRRQAQAPIDGIEQPSAEQQAQATSARRQRQRQGAARMLQAERDQVELLAVDLDSVLAADHQARLVWGYVEQQDWSELENRIKARGSVPGRRAIDPRILFALWLYATLQGVGSGREIARLSRTHDAYRWIWGGVGVNYHAERLSRRERTVVRRPAQRQRGGAGGYWRDHAQARGARRGARARQCRGGGLQAARTAVEMLQPRGFGRIRLRRIEGDSGAQVVPFVEASIEPGAQVRTDGLVAYRSLSQLGYQHQRTNLHEKYDYPIL